MLLEAIYHRPKQNWCYAYDERTIHIRIRTKRDDIDSIQAMTGDKYAWEQTLTYIPMTIMSSDELFDYWECEVIPPHRRLKYGFILQKGKEKLWMTEYTFLNEPPENPDRLFDFPYINQVDVFTTPEWVKDAVFYQIFPERFANGDASLDPKGTLPWGGKPERENFFGGDLQGVIDHIDHLSNLGINAIYFTPLFTATTNHKYDTEDYLQIDPQFGDAELLKKLVSICHERGIRVLLDAVFNHSGRTFAPFVDVQKNGEQSRYKDWFHVNKFPITVENGIPTYETFAFEPLMPKLNTENPEVKAYLLKVAEYWIKDIGIDGWRLDVANEVDHQFWREFRQVVKKTKPDAYILGEIWHESSNWLQGDQFDAVMNYPFTNATLDFFVEGSTDAEGFSHAIGKQLARYPQQANEVTFNLLDSHDTARLITLCKDDQRKMKLATTFMLTFSGTPCIYYGDEVGITGGQDPDCRKCMEWDPKKQDQELFKFYQELIKLRLDHRALRTGKFTFLASEAGQTTLAYAREDDQEKFVILMNNDSKAQSIKIDIEDTQFMDVHSSKTYAFKNGSLNVKLLPYESIILKAIR
ncbi:glycoside hydrolase family 13 protein [Paenibacillus crassostreae]|uniref:Alpha-glycosidase n=1 Tax=Paenibacillus crassostreae TaxID=1763538 RepID=A0A167BU09_9BACL|nr:glycoside hydrolase family 13 protein [Paenibacillus crassostreae]AOZ92493.1 alpha-glycosidase [Paenibacillus crassostreae]OAB72442.1 alpha-glycosidase [Paenibacillus crassostreae]